MDISIRPSRLSGEIAAIPSKSAAHRLLICAALADKETSIKCPYLSKDIEATARCLQALGAKIDYSDGVFRVEPIKKAIDGSVLDCGESGSTLRFLLPVVCALGCKCQIKMHGRLPQRPLSPLWELLCENGAVLTKPDEDTIQVEGKLLPGEYSIRADVSSQYISGLLFALPLLGEKSSIELTGRIESAGYILMTLQAQKEFDLDIPGSVRFYSIPAEAKYLSPGEAIVEGDWSNAAFWLAASSLNADSIKVTGLNMSSLQSDSRVSSLIEIIREGDCRIDVKDVPDLVPVLSVVAAVSPGKTEFINAGRLRIKESDRLETIHRMLTAIGAESVEKEEGLIVYGQSALSGGIVNAKNDHRIVMSAAVAATVCEGPVTILGAEAVEKSYPTFFEDFKMLGGELG